VYLTVVKDSSKLPLYIIFKEILFDNHYKFWANIVAAELLNQFEDVNSNMYLLDNNICLTYNSSCNSNSMLMKDILEKLIFYI